MNGRKCIELETGEGKELIGQPDYGQLIIEMVHYIGKSDDKFLKQIYTIMHRHIKKEG